MFACVKVSLSAFVIDEILYYTTIMIYYNRNIFVSLTGALISILVHTGFNRFYKHDVLWFS